MSGLIELIIFLAVIFGPAAMILWARDRRRIRKLSAAGLLPTDKTILSGTAPHLMGGELSERLLGLAALPECKWAEGNAPDGLLEQALEAAKGLAAFSVLCIVRSEGTTTRTKKEGIDLSWRADGIRPSRMHVSQAGWNNDRKLYELDEWITLDNKTYMNAGLWFKAEDQEAVKDNVQLNKELLPETFLYRLLSQGIERTGILQGEGTAYLCLETTVKEQAGTLVKMQGWMEQNSNLIRKFRMAAYENNVLMGEEISSFTDAPSDLSIQAPAGIETDGGEPTDSFYYIVEHW